MSYGAEEVRMLKRSAFDQPWYTTAEVARRLRLDDGDIVALLRRGELAGIHVAGAWRIAADDLERFLGRARRPARPAWRPVVAGAAALAVLTGMVGVLRAQAVTAGSHTVPYEGFLEKAGTPVDGGIRVRFSLFPTVDATTPAWTEDHVTTVSAGRFSVTLGDSTALDGVLQAGGNLFLGLEVQGLLADGSPAEGLTPLAGRQAWGSTGFAWRGAPGRDFTVDRNLRAAGNAQLGSLTVSGPTATGDLTVVPQDAVSEGGELRLSGTGGYRDWQVDNMSGQFRLHTGGVVNLSVAGAGDLSVLGTINGAGGRADCGVPTMEFAGCRANFANVAITACDFRVCNACGCGAWNPPGPGGQSTQILRANPGY